MSTPAPTTSPVPTTVPIERGMRTIIGAFVAIPLLAVALAVSAVVQRLDPTADNAPSVPEAFPHLVIVVVVVVVVV